MRLQTHRDHFFLCYYHSNARNLCELSFYHRYCSSYDRYRFVMVMFSSSVIHNRYR